MKDQSNSSFEEKKESLAENIALGLGIPVIKYSTEEEKQSIAKAIMLCLGIPVIKNILGDGVSRSNSSNELDDKLADMQSITDRIRAFSTLHAIRQIDKEKSNKLIDEAHKSEPDDEEERNNKINAIKAELALKTAQIQQLMEEEDGEDALIRKEGIDKTRSSADGAFRATEEANNADRDAGKYRLLSSLVFFGILDVLDILSVALSHFGEVGEKFYQAVGDVLGDEKVMSFFSEINKALKIDWVAEQVSKLPILKEVNQSATDLLTSEYLNSFTSIGNDLLASDPADYALRVAAVVWTINNEVGINNNYEVADERTTKAREECKKKLNDMYSGVKLAKRAEDIIKKETENELKIIYIDAGKRFAKDKNYVSQEDLQEDLKAIEIKHNSVPTNALDLFKDNDLPAINKHLSENVEDSQRLASIAMKHREIFKDDEEVNEKREELLRKSLNGLKLTAIKNVLMRMGDNNVKELGERIDENSGDDYAEKEWVLDKIIKDIANKDGDKVIISLAILAQKDEKIALIRDGQRVGRNDSKTEGGDIPGSSPATEHSLEVRPVATNLLTQKKCALQAQAAGVFPPPAFPALGRVP
jgi:hypothetical protein